MGEALPSKEKRGVFRPEGEQASIRVVRDRLFGSRDISFGDGRDRWRRVVDDERDLVTKDFISLKLIATNTKGEVVGRFEEAFLVEDDRREFRSAQYNEAFLRELAERSGGALYDLDRLDALAEIIPLPARLDDEPVVLHLWHLPIFYILLAGMWILEWYLRRRRGQA